MEELRTDILVIGSGLAGLLSALKAERAGLRVLLVGKFAIGVGTNTSLANGVFTASNSRFSEEAHLQATLATGTSDEALIFPNREPGRRQPGARQGLRL